MIYPDNFETKIGFTAIREQLDDLCLSALGPRHVQKMQFLAKYDLVAKLLDQVEEFRQILTEGADFPAQHYHDVHQHLVRAALPGAYLEVSAFYEIWQSLTTIRRAVEFFNLAPEGRFPTLRLLALGVQADRNLLAAIERIVGDDGQVRDDASPELRRLREALISAQATIRKQIQTILRHAKAEGWAADDAEPTIRGGRIVLPILSEAKRRLKGLIHDESATGQTVYLEPEAIFELNNDIKDFENAWHRELIRILTDLTDRLRPHVPDLRRAYMFLGIIDFIRAKARFAVSVEAIRPVLHRQPQLNWHAARHPLLLQHLRELKRELVPLSLRLDVDQRLLLISGPNAGGKSVTLKTVGLLQYMLQCGLLLPAGPDSEAGLFEEILLDIGDSQSIDNDLSTYSSHLLSMKQFLLFAGKRSLVLIDEFGTGTEPALGGAIAEAVVEALNRARAFGVITTHYTNLKNFAERSPGVVNGAMRYDTKALRPLYQLEIGKPGSSFAIEIARKTGLPKEIVDRASNLVGKDKIRYDHLLEQLETEKNDLQQKLRDAERHERELRKAVSEYETSKKLLDSQKSAILREAKQHAKLLLRDTNRQIETTISEIRASQADKEVTKQAREKLDEFVKRELKIEPVKPNPDQVAEEGPLHEGDSVTLVGHEGVGKLISLKGNQAEVMFGTLRTIARLPALQRATREEVRLQKAREAKQVSAPTTGLDTTSRMAEFQHTLDIRGQYADDALRQVMSFLDDAVMLGVPEVKFIHGRGNGVLRKVIRDYLRTQRQVASVADEDLQRGGDGATVAVLK
ncbi:MAG: Smr/MutS family protein [Hymenobacteraceae bacterium]|nr:Smr/MutS family protein [Hymenobacteraceae bacterium]